MALFKIIIRNRLPRCGLLRQGESFLHVKYKHSSCSSIFIVSDEVSEAIAKEKPVVALESTIITHGMPYPHNCETALAVEEIIREQNAIPATIAVKNGVIRVGLDPHEIEELARPEQNKIKISRRDFPYAISQKLSGGTTVSGTMIIAHKAGIPIFVTGGIGGVHRDGENSMDISADLTELGRTPVAVISSGIKSILDIGRTLEFLETQGVAVASLGDSNEFPAFYSRKSGFLVPYHLKSIDSAASFVHSIFDLGLNSGVLIGVPIPKEFAFEEKAIEEAIVKGIKEAKRENIKGKDVTPFILNQVSKITDGKSLQSNIALIKNNAFIGTLISVELGKLRSRRLKETCFGSVSYKELDHTVRVSSTGDKKGFHSCSVKADFEEEDKPFEVTVIGGSNLDYVVRLEDDELKMDGRTLGGKIHQSGGGVGRNIADALGKLGMKPYLMSAVGVDHFGEYLLEQTIPHLSSKGILKTDSLNTATCTVLCDHDGECKLVVGDMKVHDLIDENYVREHEGIIKESSLVVFDGNLRLETIDCLLNLCAKYSVPVWFEPTDVSRATKPFLNKSATPPAFISPNYMEFLEIYKLLNPEYVDRHAESHEGDEFLYNCINQAYFVAEVVDNVIITLGKRGVLVVRRGGRKDSFFTIDSKGRRHYNHNKAPISHNLYKPSSILSHEIVNVSGAGDCFASGFISAMLKGHNEEYCVDFGFKCSLASLKCATTVPHHF